MKKRPTAIVYTVNILLLAVVVCTVLVVLVLPNFVQNFNFAEVHATLPLSTRIMLAIGSFASVRRIQILVTVFAIVVGVTTLVRVRR
ncbi:MAG TPA: hypothetical protein VGS16_11475 [Candidatus Dormibacteraeota bacterium]|nr:hypothetical protein [Candidatus Dormibacteraeota bacterium]